MTIEGVKGFCLAICFLVVFATGCGRRETRVASGDREQILHRGNGAEPQDIDPQTVTGVTEDHIIMALIEGLVSRIKAEYGQPMTVIATGGLAALFHKQVAVIDHLDADLTISGLIRIHARNAKK